MLMGRESPVYRSLLGRRLRAADLGPWWPRRLAARALDMATQPWDSEDEIARKAVLMILTVVAMVAAVVWGTAYTELGLADAAGIPISLGVASLLTLVYLLVFR